MAKKVNGNLFTNVASQSSEELVYTYTCVEIELCWFLRRGENRSTQRKNSQSKERTNNKLNPHMTPGPGIEPRRQGSVKKRQISNKLFNFKEVSQMEK